MRKLLIMAVGTAMIVGCGGKGKTISISFDWTPEATSTPEATATPLPYAQYAQDFITGIGIQEHGDSVEELPLPYMDANGNIPKQGHLSAADEVDYQKAKDWVLSLCSQTGLFPDADWKAVFNAACQEIWPFVIQYKGPGPYNRAIQILQNALNNGP